MRSMTGFGRSCGEIHGRRSVVEIRSVNHRFLEIKLRLPPPWSDPVIEQLLMQAIRRRVDRGSLVVTLREEGTAREAPVVRIDVEMARAYARALRDLARAVGLSAVHPDEAPLGSGASSTAGAQLLQLLASQPGVLHHGEVEADPAERFGLLQPIVEEALSALLACRQREGDALAGEILRRVAGLSTLLAEVARLAVGAPELHRRRLEERLSRLIDGGTSIDPQRLAQEVALIADRIDVTEEITRVRTHLAEFTRLCHSESLSGRRLDFLTQEINREINTISAKAQSAEVATRVVAMKAELERLREQIQNVE